MVGDNRNHGGRVVLRHGKVKPIIFRHPWVYTASIKRVEGSPANGDLVQVHDEKGNFLAQGFYNDNSQIAVRLISWNRGDIIGHDFFREKIGNALRLRSDLLGLSVDGKTDCYRVIHSEADELPGLIVDRYGDYLVVQVTCLGLYRHLDSVLDVLQEYLHPLGVFERSDSRMCEKEGMEQNASRILRGGSIPQEIIVRENGIKFSVDLRAGQKTGFYSDQRDNRLTFAPYARGKRVLDAFSYTGAFALYASKIGGAESVLAVESSTGAVETGQKNCGLNNVRNIEFIQANVIQFLKDAAQRNETFDAIVLDPPKLAPTKKDVDKALRKYTEINQLALRCISHGGVLVTCSCSHHISNRFFDRMLAEAAISSRSLVQILEHRGQSPDHPIKSGLEEGNYLKCRICRVTKY